eukprot:SAG22_NODE_205_length_15308_cov_20.539023_16_plen_68_part_00
MVYSCRLPPTCQAHQSRRPARQRQLWKHNRKAVPYYSPKQPTGEKKESRALAAALDGWYLSAAWTDR